MIRNRLRVSLDEIGGKDSNSVILEAAVGYCIDSKSHLCFDCIDSKSHLCFDYRPSLVKGRKAEISGHQHLCICVLFIYISVKKYKN